MAALHIAAEHLSLGSPPTEPTAGADEVVAALLSTPTLASMSAAAVSAAIRTVGNAIRNGGSRLFYQDFCLTHEALLELQEDQRALVRKLMRKRGFEMEWIPYTYPSKIKIRPIGDTVKASVAALELLLDSRLCAAAADMVQ